MSNVESAIIPGIRITSTWQLALAWIGASIVAVPLAVLLHEVGPCRVLSRLWISGRRAPLQLCDLRYGTNILATDQPRKFRRRSVDDTTLESGDRYCRRITCYVRRSPRSCFLPAEKSEPIGVRIWRFARCGSLRESRCFWPGFREDL